ncbi:F-box/WD repeat-containing protein 7-like isoform X3 [Gigantopelta aegis]|uniref:F-box/WD repeat-containing protein 7-like isoform X3 n=1 Tax=Gigantopelta aegis TaxID=1735272 RepID=UPI001B8897AC|nr:F-box/WD repeat-containing protein 7-like isoform X3 [Gigantopelta aegis]
MDFTRYLPVEIVQKILIFFKPAELARFSLCCVQWREVSNLDALWLHFCIERGWLRFGLMKNCIDLINQETLYPMHTNISGLSPQFSLNVPSDTRLSSICKWKNIFIRVLHLNTNWKTGRYTVASIRRGHLEKVSAMDCNDNCIVSGSEDKRLQVWDIKTCTCTRRIMVHSDTVTAVKLRGNMIVTGCADSSIRIIDSTSGKMKHSFQGHSGSVDHIVLIGDMVVSAGSDRTVRVWSLTEKRLKHVLRKHTDEIECLCSYGNCVVSGSWDKSLILWNIDSGKLIHQYSGHGEVVTCCQFDDQKVVSGSADGLLRIWTVDSDECSRVLYGHEGEVYCLVYNRFVIASGCSDSTVIIWSHQGPDPGNIRRTKGNQVYEPNCEKCNSMKKSLKRKKETLV